MTEVAKVLRRKLNPLEDNMKAADIELTPEDLRAIERAVSTVRMQGVRHPEQLAGLTPARNGPRVPGLSIFSSRADLR